MFSHIFFGSLRPNVDDLYKRPSVDKRQSCCSRCCVIFFISFSFTGFVMCLLSGLYLLLIQQRPTYFPYFLLFALICLCVFVYVITSYGSSLSTGRSTLLSFEVPTTENFRNLLRRSQSDGVMINIPGQAESTLSLPAYILIPAGQERRESSGASTESTLSAEESREGLDEEAAGSKKKAERTPLVGEALGEATETVVNFVDETLRGRGGAEEAAEGSSELSAEARRVLIQGVRQRRQSPMEPRKDVPSSEDEKKE